MTLEFVTEYLDKKISENPNFIRCTYYDFLVKNKRMNAEKYDFLNFARIRLNNMNYKVDTEGQKYEYNGKTKEVQINELLIAIKK